MKAISHRAKPKVLFIIPSLAGGGAERVMVTLLRYLDREKFEPVLVLFKKNGAYVADVPADVRIYDLGKKSRWDFPRLIWRLAWTIKNESPTVVVSFLWYANVVAVLAGILVCHHRVIISERNTPSRGLRGENLGWIKSFLVTVLYRRSYKVVAVSMGAKDDLLRAYGLPPSKIEVIYNPVDIHRIQKLATEPINDLHLPNQDEPVVIAVGRLEQQKGYPYLLRAFSEVRKKVPSKLLILGEGSRRRELETLASQLGISDSVIFKGFDPNPYKYMKKASVFVLSSLYEGFPNVILEAMVCGVPVVATDCPSGPSEIIIHGVNGLLVPVGDTEALAEAILSVLQTNSLASRLVENARLRMQDFGLSQIVSQWEQLFQEAFTQWSLA